MKKLETNDRFITTREAAEIVGLSISTVRRLIASGDFPKTFKITQSRIGLLESEVRHWMENVANGRGAANDN